MNKKYFPWWFSIQHINTSFIFFFCFTAAKEMHRTYIRHTDMGLVHEEAMVEAVKVVINWDCTSIRKVAKEKGISKSVLARYVQKYKADENCKMSPNYIHSQIFTPVIDFFNLYVDLRLIKNVFRIIVWLTCFSFLYI